MATIRSTLSLQDKYSSTLNKIGSNLNKTKGLFSKFKSTVSRGFNTSGFKELNDRIIGTGAEAEKMGSVFKSVLGANLVSGAVMSGLSAVSSSIKGVFSTAIAEGGKLQQSLGGIDTLYNGAEKLVKTYAAEAAKAGISANTYAEQAVSFGASLKQALGGDAVAAAEAANKAILDMADNSAKMGTDIELVQQTYQSLARGNYAMLDNLKLGFGGTKSEMQRLLDTAEKLTGKKYDIDNFADITSAIHEVQNSLGIAGVAALEAETTLTGSFAATKASFQNFVGNLAIGADITKPLKDMATSASKFLFKNFLPMTLRVFKGLPSAISEFIKASKPEIVSALKEFFPSDVADSVGGFFDGVVQKVQDFKTWIDQIGSTGAFTAVKDAAIELGLAFGHIVGSLTNAETASSSAETIGTAIKTAANAVKGFAEWLRNLDPSTIQTIAKAIIKFKIGMFALRGARGIWQGVATGIGTVKNALGFGKQLGSVVKNLFKLSTWKAPNTPSIPKTPDTSALPSPEPVTQSGNAAGGAAAKFLKFGVALLLVGAGVLLVAGGIWILVQAAIQLGNAGSSAYIGLAVLVGIIFLFGAALYFAAPALTAGAVGMIAFGVAVLLVGAGMMLVGAGVLLVAGGIWILVQAAIQLGNAGSSAYIGLAVLVGIIFLFGAALYFAAPALTIAAVGVLLLGTAMIVLGTGVLLAAVGFLLFSASVVMVSAFLPMFAMGMMLVSTGMILLGAMSMLATMQLMLLLVPLTTLAALFVVSGAAAMLCGAGLMVFGVMALGAFAGLLMLRIALSGVDSNMKSIAKNARSSASNLTKMTSSIDAVSSGLNAIKSKAQGAVSGLLSAFQGAIGPAQSSGQQLGQASGSGVGLGIASSIPLAVAQMQLMITMIRTTGLTGASTMVSIGLMIGQGLAQGMNSALGVVREAASALVKEAEKAAQAKAKIHSPSRLFRDEVGRYMGQGLAIGLLSTAGLVSNVGQSLVDNALPNHQNDYSMNVTPSTGLGTSNSGTYAGNGSTSTTTNENTTFAPVFNFSDGAIVIQSTGDSVTDAKNLLAELDRLVQEEYSRSLSHT